jgi:glycosyltransferase involved in cell wall biosynthesis
MTKPLVSVVIPVYNCADVLSETIDSVLKQTYGNIEIIVVDDGSTDGTGRVAEGYLESGKVRCFHQENGGPGAARNRGIQAARGEYLVFTDADDSLTDDSIEKRMALLFEVGDLELIYSNYFIRVSKGEVTDRFDGTYPEKYKSLCREYVHGVVFEGSPSEIFEIPFDFWTGTVLVARNLMERVGPFRTDISIGEDRDMWIRMSMDAGKIGYIRSPVACYNRSRSGLTGGDPVRYAIARRDLNYYFLEKYGRSSQRRNVEKVIYESLSWVYFDLGKHYRKSGMKGSAIGNFLKSIYFSPKNDLPYKEIVSSILPRVLRDQFKKTYRYIPPFCR